MIMFGCLLNQTVDNTCIYSSIGPISEKKTNICSKFSVFAINSYDFCLLNVLYVSEVGRFRVEVGLGAPINVYIYIKGLEFV